MKRVPAFIFKESFLSKVINWMRKFSLPEGLAKSQSVAETIPKGNNITGFITTYTVT